MSEPASNPAVREALARLIEGEAEPADEALIERALRADPALSTALRQQLQLDELLRQEALGDGDDFAAAVGQRIAAGADAETFEQRVAAAVTGGVRKRRFFGSWLALVAASAVLLSVGVWWFRGRDEAPAVELARVSGAVSWSNESGDWKSGLGSGTPLDGGTLTVEGETSTAALLFRDGTRVALNGDAELTFSDEAQKRLRCARGSLWASVAPQPRDQPMLLRTPTAEIEVLGTVFSVDAQATSTSVSVERGRVRVRRLDNPEVIEVEADQKVVVTAGRAMLPLEPQPAPAAVSSWRASLEAPLDSRFTCLWLPPDGRDPQRLGTVPLLVGARQKFLKPGIKVKLEGVSGQAGGVAINSRTTLRLRVRALGDEQFDVFINTTHPIGVFSGNFQRIVSLGRIPADADGWRTVEVALAEIQPVAVYQHDYPSALGTRVKVMLLTASADFELAALEITDG